MNAASSHPNPAAGLTPAQKLAALLIILGGEGAAQVLRNLSEQEIEAASSEMAKLSVITPEMRTQILREFGEVVVRTTTGIRGGAEFAQTALEKAVGAAKADVILNRVAPDRALSPAVSKIAELDASQIANVLRLERPQTVALAVSCLPPKKASDVLGLLPNDTREQTVERMATLGATPVATVERVVELVLSKAGPQSAHTLSQPGGIKATATILNALDRRVCTPLLTALEERNPELVQALRQKMFTFEDVAKLAPTAIQRILREVDLRDLAMALKSASDSVRDAMLSCISKRAAETVMEEMTYMGTVKIRDIEGAHLRIVGIVRQLEAEGEIELGEETEAAQPEPAK